jgi:hypothetical protein
MKSATPAFAAVVPAGTAVPPRRVREAPGELARGVERRYNAPVLTEGTGLVLPAGVKAVPVRDFYRRPHLTSASSMWPQLKAMDGTIVDGSVVPGRGASTRIAILGEFTDGWYELLHANGRADRVTWDARAFPFLWFYGEFGATNEHPYRGRFYTLALQPLSRSPYPRGRHARTALAG